MRVLAWRGDAQEIKTYDRAGRRGHFGHDNGEGAGVGFDYVVFNPSQVELATVLGESVALLLR